MPVNAEVLDRIETNVLAELNARDDVVLARVHVWIRGESVAAEQAGEFGFSNSGPPGEAVPVLVDLHPELNWAHPCEIRLHDAGSGELLAKTSALLPPADFYLNRNAYVPAHTPDPFPNSGQAADPTESNNFLASIGGQWAPGNRYALLFSGMSDNRHLNDLEYLYRTLIDVYEWDPAAITVLNFDGTVNYAGAPSPIGNWPGDQTPYRIKVDGAGNFVNLNMALKNIGDKLQPEDLLLIHTNNHGGPLASNGQSGICCYPNWQLLDENLFGWSLAAMQPFASLIVMMEQCNSGGFQAGALGATANSISFAAACQADRSSAGGPLFDPFAYSWIKAMQTASTSAAAAFTTANAEKVPYDTPVYGDKPDGAGSQQFL